MLSKYSAAVLVDLVKDMISVVYSGHSLTSIDQSLSQSRFAAGHHIPCLNCCKENGGFTFYSPELRNRVQRVLEVRGYGREKIRNSSSFFAGDWKVRSVS